MRLAYSAIRKGVPQIKGGVLFGLAVLLTACGPKSAELERYSLIDRENATWRLDTATGAVCIPILFGQKNEQWTRCEETSPPKAANSNVGRYNLIDKRDSLWRFDSATGETCEIVGFRDLNANQTEVI